VSDLLASPDPMSCQVVQAPEGDGRRLVPDPVDTRPMAAETNREPDGDEEIRLTYRELSALIEDAIRSLR